MSKNLVFPQGFEYDIKQDRFISAGISPLYKCTSEENITFKANNSTMVTLKPAIYRLVAAEIIRWNEVLRGFYNFKPQLG